jgi:hypothetical protein
MYWLCALALGQVHGGHNKYLLYFRPLCRGKTCSQDVMLLRVHICNSFALCCDKLGNMEEGPITFGALIFLRFRRKGK